VAPSKPTSWKSSRAAWRIRARLRRPRARRPSSGRSDLLGLASVGVGDLESGMNANKIA